MDNDDGIRSGDSKKELKSGNEFAANRQMGRACGLWQSAAKRDPRSPALQYNLGVCEESNGNLAGAMKQFQASEGLLSKPDRRVADAIERVQQRLADAEKLKKQK